jgi:hypothetical protein
LFGGKIGDKCQELGITKMGELKQISQCSLEEIFEK